MKDVEDLLFSDVIEKLKTKDKAHADIFNNIFEKLLNNDIFVKEIAEASEKEIKHLSDNMIARTDEVYLSGNLSDILKNMDLSKNIIVFGTSDTVQGIPAAKGWYNMLIFHYHTECVLLASNTWSPVNLYYTKFHKDGENLYIEEWKKLITEKEIINPNILINPDFKINQRGQTEYTATHQYTVDRWKINGGTNNIVRIYDGYMKLIATSTEQYKEIQQYIENFSDYRGETITLSARIRTTSTHSYIQIHDNVNITWSAFAIPDGNWHTISVKTKVSEHASFLKVGAGIYIDHDGELDIQWAKLEIGDIATKFTPVDPATELMKCQRYYKELNIIASPNTYTQDLLDFHERIGNMRIYPALSFKNNLFEDVAGICVRVESGVPALGFHYDLIKTTELDGYFMLRATKNNHGLTKNNSLIVVGKNNPICLDAEIYKEEY